MNNATSLDFIVDARVREKLFMSSPAYPITFTLLYLLTTFTSLKFMRNNPKYVINTKWPNIVLIVIFLIVSANLLMRMVNYMMWSRYNFRCMAVDTTWRPEVLEVMCGMSSTWFLWFMLILTHNFRLQIIETFHTFFLLKLSYYLETIFFTLTGRFELMTSYIIAHHATYPLLLWYALAIAPGGHGVFFIAVNLTTHLIYFSQRLIMLPFPSMNRSWTQKFFIWLHVVQFGVILLHGCQLLFNNFCNYPIEVTYCAVVWGLVMIGMYGANWLNRTTKESRHKSDKINWLWWRREESRIWKKKKREKLNWNWKSIYYNHVECEIEISAKFEPVLYNMIFRRIQH